ncbi:MAG: DHHA1 domain-containing protein [Candidatus Micrarchaeota archaeon]
MKEKLPELLARLRDKKLVLTTHRKADTDGITCLYALKELLPTAVVALTQEKDEGARQLMEHLHFEAKNIDDLKPADYDGLVVVDTSSTVLVPAAPKWKVLLVIDHHQAQGRDIIGEYNVIDSKAVATAEILGRQLGGKLSQKAAFALACGIVFDSARFKSARKETFAVLAKLMRKAKTSYDVIRSFAEPEKTRSERLAILNGFQRVELYEIGPYMVVTSNVGSNGSDVASALAEAAHAAFVADWKEDLKETRLSARAAREFPLQLNEICAAAAKQLGGNGGGHAKAAGLSVKGKKPDEVLKACIEATTEFARSHAKLTLEDAGRL